MTTETPKPRRPRKPQSRLPAALAVVEERAEIALELTQILDAANPVEVVTLAMDLEKQRHAKEMDLLRSRRTFAEAIVELTDTEKRHLRTVLAEVAGARG